MTDHRSSGAALSVHEHVDLVEREAHEILQLARHRLDAAVPACAGWRVGDLVQHLQHVYAVACAVVRDRVQESPVASGLHRALRPPRPDAAALDRQARHLVAALRSAPPETPVWTAHKEHRTASYWARRMAHESVIHRADVEQATRGREGPVPIVVALDGIDEMVNRHLIRLHRDRPIGHGERIVFAPTDSAAAWSVRMSPKGVVVVRPDDGADAIVRGPAESVYLWLWGRASHENLEVDGEVDLVRRVRSLSVL